MTLKPITFDKLELITTAEYIIEVKVCQRSFVMHQFTNHQVPLMTNDQLTNPRLYRGFKNSRFVIDK